MSKVLMKRINFYYGITFTYFTIHAYKKKYIYINNKTEYFLIDTNRTLYLLLLSLSSQ